MCYPINYYDAHHLLAPITDQHAKVKSTADFINKIVIVEEEADESIYWLELMEESCLVKPELIMPLKKEANELTAIFTAIGKLPKQIKPRPNQKIKTLI